MPPSEPAGGSVMPSSYQESVDILAEAMKRRDEHVLARWSSRKWLGVNEVVCRVNVFVRVDASIGCARHPFPTTSSRTQ